MKANVKIILGIVIVILLIVIVVLLIPEPKMTSAYEGVTVNEDDFDYNITGETFDPANIEKRCNVSCEIDNDCVKVDEYCCGCELGGKAVAIHTSCLEGWNHECTYTSVACSPEQTQHISCVKEAACVNNKCELV